MHPSDFNTDKTYMTTRIVTITFLWLLSTAFDEKLGSERANLVLVINLILAVVKIIVGSQTPEPSFNTRRSEVVLEGARARGN